MSDTIDPMITDEQDAKPEGQATAAGAVPGPRLDRAGQQRLAEQLVEQAGRKAWIWSARMACWRS